ncbi:PhzF family phenazine biosynthesis protein [Streptomyces yangpuensis]|uniref:PhzF family phenazine biosynthesis protein n=1 Tax=Streptomyces yangpuensis TaxID=1648182 RepID=UPI0006293816
MTDTEVLRCTAFSGDPDGGNPAGVVLDASGPDQDAPPEIAAGLDSGETAFLTAPPEALAALDRPQAGLDLWRHPRTRRRHGGQHRVSVHSAPPATEERGPGRSPGSGGARK